MSNSKIRNFGLKHYNLSLVLAVAVLFGLCLLNHWIFLRLFDRQYVLWFIKTGPLIALVTTVASTAWGGLDKVPGLISANPYAYVGSYLQVISLTGAGILPHLDSRNHSTIPNLWDYLASFVYMIGLIIVIAAWLVIVVPFQYFVYLVTGSIARMVLRSSVNVIATYERDQLQVMVKPDDVPIPKNGWDASSRDKPYRVTNAFTAAFLFMVGLLIQ